MESTFEQARRDVERSLSRLEFAQSLRDLADCLEQGKPYAIAIDGQMVVPPADATLSVEHERSEGEEELEFQLRWRSDPRGGLKGPLEGESDEDRKEVGDALS